MSNTAIQKYVREHPEMFACPIDTPTPTADARDLIRKLIAWESPVLLSYLVYLKEQEQSGKLEDNHGYILDNIINNFVFTKLTEENSHSGIQKIDVTDEGKLDVYYGLIHRNSEGTLEAINNLFTPDRHSINPFTFFKNDVNELSLDYILPHYKNFKTLNQNIKKRIIALEFINDYVKKRVINEENISVIRESIVESRKRRLHEDIESVNKRIDDHSNEIRKLSEKYQTLLQNYAGIESTEINEDKLKKAIKDPRIIDVKFSKRSQTIDIVTHPIYLSYDVEKKEANKHTARLKENERLCIGEHFIRISLEDLQISFRHLTDNYRNHHVEQYTCYGNFAEPLNKARIQYDLPRVISLALQMVSHATIGDPAGNETLAKAFVVNSNEAVINESKEEEHVLLFVERNQNENYRHFVEVEE